MNEQSQSVTQSFADRIRVFHAGLPAEEQALLEEMVALAELAAARDADTKGHARLTDVLVTGYTVSPTLHGALRLDPVGKNQSGRGQPSAGWDLTQQRPV